MVKISASIVTYNNESSIEKCVASILRSAEGLDFQLYISDNASTDRTVEIVKEKFPAVIVIKNNKNGGFGWGHNIVLNRIDSDVHFLINPDIYMKEDSFRVLAAYLWDHKEVSLVTPRVLNTDGTEQFLPKFGPTIRYVIISKLPGFHKYRRQYTRQDEKFTKPTEVEFCTGCFFAVRTEEFRRLGGFSKQFYMYFEDADLSRRVLRDGKKIVFNPETSVYHDWHRDNTGSIKGATRFLKSMCKYFSIWGVKF